MVVSGSGEVRKTLGVDIALLSLFSVSPSSVCLSVVPLPLAITTKWLSGLTTFFAPISLLKQRHGWR